MGIRVAYLTHYADLYGANRSLLDLMLQLRAAHNVEPMVFLPVDGPLIERLADLGIAHKVVPWAPWMTKRHYEGGWHHRFQQHIRYLRQARGNRIRNKALRPILEEQLAKWGTQLVHVNSLAVGMATELVGRLSIPLVWHMREMPERHYGFHHDHGVRAYVDALKKADARIAISDAVRKDVAHRIGPSVPVEVVHNGIYTAPGFAAAALGSEERWRNVAPFTFLMAGVIHPAKGHDEAIAALAIVLREHKARLRIIGGGNKDGLRRAIHAQGLQDQVDLLDYADDLSEFYGSGHALLMCSRHEALGRVTIEAMAHGLPVIGRAEGGTLEVIEDGSTGLLYDKGPEELAVRMLQLIRDPEGAREMATAAMRDVAVRFTVEGSADRVMQRYTELLQDHGAKS
ncbi:MAG: glycosyltransferase family 4 protein [Flavobacteriales bacterium]|jgi:glycosyltransferase involved in cell wall biosynthesis|nr:glycosyltransferase family 4 protein [Flavobacteriales bacterium]MBK7482115.1 glycosyltransferase family 4 protein [Flavobacteriales bacterium]MBK7619087.1 glycosyltransferase family 4 protein [Flavobacteriales bacterium]MBK8707745.1 glycosyltransferase family 4 protein [Flavobacteriales bacterium]